MTALAHPTRRAILERLMRGEARVTDLAKPFKMGEIREIVERQLRQA